MRHRYTIIYPVSLTSRPVSYINKRGVSNGKEMGGGGGGRPKVHTERKLHVLMSPRPQYTTEQIHEDLNSRGFYSLTVAPPCLRNANISKVRKCLYAYHSIF